MESNSKLYLLVLYIGFLAPFLYVWTKNYPQVVGTCSGHHGQLISQNCVLTKIRAEPPPPPPLKWGRGAKKGGAVGAEGRQHATLRHCTWHGHLREKVKFLVSVRVLVVVWVMVVVRVMVRVRVEC